MLRLLLADLPATYLLLRVGNVAVRPVSLFVYAVAWDDLSVSTIALSYTFGAWLMVPMAFGSYRWVLPIERRYAHNAVFRIRANRVYSLIVAFSIVTVTPIVYQISASIMGNIHAGLLVTMENSARTIPGERW